MKKKILVAVVLMAIVFSSAITGFAGEENVSGDGYIAIEKKDINQGEALTYGLIVDKDGNLKAIDSYSIIDTIFGTQIYVGTLTINSWVGSNVNFTINITSSGSAIKRHTGTIEFYKVNSIGTMGSLFNSDTFSLRYGAGTKTMTDVFNMNAQSNSKIYIKLTKLRVEDIMGEILALSDARRRCNKSDFS